MRNLRERQLVLLKKLAEAQETVAEGQPIDFLTVSSSEGNHIILASGETIPFNRHDLDELVDQGLVRTTLFRDYGDFNGHVTNAGFSLVDAQSHGTHDGAKVMAGEVEPFEEPVDVPTAFISYSHDSVSHKRWVRVELAERLMASGVRVILDQWHLKIGEDLPYFMERALRADCVLIVCTPAYAERANGRRGGVGYEASIITGELVSERPSVEPKFLPLLRDGDLNTARPDFLKAAFAADLRPKNLEYEAEFWRLLRQLHREPEFVAPPLGAKPDFNT